MKNLLFILLVCACVSCSKKESDNLIIFQPNPFVLEKNGNFIISIDDLLSKPIKTITISGEVSDSLAVMLIHNEQYDTTILISPDFNIANLNTKYFHFINGKNTLSGNIIKSEKSKITGTINIIYK